MPPKLYSREAMISTNLSVSDSFITNGIASMSPNSLNNIALPYMTGMPAKGPMFPKPKTAEPSEITATKWLLEVYL